MNARGKAKRRMQRRVLGREYGFDRFVTAYRETVRMVTAAVMRQEEIRRTDTPSR